jgi:hypothetical protein
VALSAGESKLDRVQRTGQARMIFAWFYEKRSQEKTSASTGGRGLGLDLQPTADRRAPVGSGVCWQGWLFPVALSAGESKLDRVQRTGQARMIFAW